MGLSNPILVPPYHATATKREVIYLCMYMRRKGIKGEKKEKNHRSQEICHHIIGYCVFLLSRLICEEYTFGYTLMHHKAEVQLLPCKKTCLRKHYNDARYNVKLQSKLLFSDRRIFKLY